MAATTEPCEDALNKLMASVNQTLVESGCFFRTSGSPQSRAQLKRTLPAANEEFQTALDQLCERIYLAKAVLERDYDMLKTKDQAMPQPSDTTGPLQPVEGANKDQEMTTDTRDQATGGTTFQISLPTSTASSAMAPEGGDSLFASTSASEAKEPSKANGDKSTLDEGMLVSSGDQTHGAEAKNEPPSHAMRSNGSNGLDAFGSLLPGLERYANAGVEENNVAVQHLKGSAENNSKGQEQQRDTTDAPQGRSDVGMEDVLLPESNFDDMFVGISDLGDGEGLLTNVDIGDLDDAWFT